jgi:hypothetical protein
MEPLANRPESSALAMPKRPGRSPLVDTEFLQNGDVVDARDEVVKANPLLVCHEFSSAMFSESCPR